MTGHSSCTSAYSFFSDALFSYSKILNFCAIIFGVLALTAMLTGDGQQDGVDPDVTFPSHNTFLYDVPQEETSPMCSEAFGMTLDSDATSSASTSPAVKYLADYNLLCKSQFVLICIA